MNSDKEIYDEEMFIELSCEEDMKIVGGSSSNSIYKTVFAIADSLCASIKGKLFD